MKDGEPWTATSTFTQLLTSVGLYRSKRYSQVADRPPCPPPPPPSTLFRPVPDRPFVVSVGVTP